MICRKPVVAGRFYPDNKKDLLDEIESYFNPYTPEKQELQPVWGVMLPHAGHIFCGDIIAKTLAGSQLPRRLLILCPNHTGYGRPLGLWSEGCWSTPLGSVKIDEKLAAEILATDSGFEKDTASHMAEHSIEVILPFLQTINEELEIVPVCVGTRNQNFLEKAASGLAEVLARPQNSNVGLVVSSDMNHYENHNRTLEKDDAALAQILSQSPAGLLELTERQNISMCGAAPMALALYTAQKLGSFSVNLKGHTTSGPVSRDYSHTVGYAGLTIQRN